MKSTVIRIELMSGMEIFNPTDAELKSIGSDIKNLTIHETMTKEEFAANFYIGLNGVIVSK